MDLKRVTLNGLNSACRMMRQDLDALPEEAFDRKFGPKARTVADLVYETTLVNDHVGMVMREEKPFDWPSGGWITAPEALRSKADVIAAFARSFDRICETVGSFTPEEFVSLLQTDEGETTRYERCQFMTLHLWYHSGQLNYIQTLLGDDAWHWR